MAVLPYLGFPLSFKNILMTLCGLEVAYLGYYFYGQKDKKDADKEKTEVFDNFSENGEFAEIFKEND